MKRRPARKRRATRRRPAPKPRRRARKAARSRRRPAAIRRPPRVPAAVPAPVEVPAAPRRPAPPAFAARWTRASDRPLADAERIPWGYGYSRLVLLPVDPSGCHAVWEILEGEVEAAYRERTLREEQVRWVLRLYDVTFIEWNGFNQHGTFDVPVDRGMRSWYVPLWSAEKGYVADLGFVDPEGRFVSMARSNTIQTPRAGASPFERPEWAEPDGRGGIRALAAEPDYRGRAEAFFVRPAVPAAVAAGGAVRTGPEALRADLLRILAPFVGEALCVGAAGAGGGGAAPEVLLREAVERLAAEPGPISFLFSAEALLARVACALPGGALRILRARLADWADRAFRPALPYRGPRAEPLPSSPAGGSVR